MKRLLFAIISLLIFVPTTLAQENTAGWGLIYGTSQEAVRKKILKERGLTPFEELCDENTLVYTDCPFAGETAYIVTVFFLDDAMSNMGISFKVDYESETFGKFDKMCELMSEKYGDPTAIREEYQHPYYKGDGYEVSAIKQKKADIMTMWSYPKHSEANVVGVSISPQLTIIISYNNVALQAVDSKRNKRKAVQDL